MFSDSTPAKTGWGTNIYSSHATEQIY